MCACVCTCVRVYMGFSLAFSTSTNPSLLTFVTHVEALFNFKAREEVKRSVKL